MKPLSSIKINQPVIIKSIECENPMRRRIMDMGLTNNTLITIKKLAPLGDPFELEIRGFSLTIRKADASKIMVEEVK
ncbi:MAG: FeoA family protein [Erysipelotrichaceae bacterium]